MGRKKKTKDSPLEAIEAPDWTCRGVRLRKRQFKWLLPLLPRKQNGRRQRVRFFELRQLGYRRINKEIHIFNRRADFTNMTFLGLADEYGKPANFCFLKLSASGNGVVVGTSIEEVMDTILGIVWRKQYN